VERGWVKGVLGQRGINIMGLWLRLGGFSPWGWETVGWSDMNFFSLLG